MRTPERTFGPMLLMPVRSVLRLAVWTALLAFVLAMIVLGAAGDRGSAETPAPEETAISACGAEA